MNRQEFFEELEEQVQTKCKELDIKLTVIDFGQTLRFHMDEIPGWFNGQYDVWVYKKQPSNQTLVKELEKFSEWFFDLPNQVKEYKRLKRKGKLELLAEINKRYQKTWNTTELHPDYKKLIE